MKTIDPPLLKKFLKLAGDRLTGEWVILGGSVLALRGHAYRVTNDIDLAGPKNSTQEQTLILMKIAEELGLPVESINQAYAFFLYKINDWQKNLTKVHEGKKAIFFSPNLTLFLLLKIQRLSETDLSDCLKMLELEGRENLNLTRIHKEISTALKKEKNPRKKERLRQLKTSC